MSNFLIERDMARANNCDSIEELVVELEDSLYKYDNHTGMSKFSSTAHEYYSLLPAFISNLKARSLLENRIVDEFDKTIKLLHESTHDKRIREALLTTYSYKIKYLNDEK